MKKTLWSLIAVVALAIAAAGLYLWLEGEPPEPQVAQPPPPPEEPAIRHPIEAAGTAAETGAETTNPLPSLAESDSAMREALENLFGRKLEKFFNLQEIIRRIVATVDNLPREEAPMRLMPVKPVPGVPITTGKGHELSLSPKNAARYGPYVRLMEAVPTLALVSVYVRFYPLFQQQYEELGYPGKYFNDRLVDVIDHLLAAPEVQGPLRVTQPKVLYKFADPELEALSAGQKIMVRMGPENSSKVKAKLREIRNALVSAGPNR